MDTTIVGIGSSAGGLEALTEMLDAMPSDTGLAFVIVQHMSRSGPSMMVDLLARHTAMAVRSIKTGDIPAPNTVYIIPPGYHVTMYESALALQEVVDDQHLRTPIDLFFKSLAEEKGSDAYAVVLSGTGSDGTIGICAIKKGGGVTIAQRSDSAKFSGMPDSAAATGFVDFLLRPREISTKLLELEHFRNSSAEHSNKKLLIQIEKHLPEVLDALKENDRSNFQHYKPGTLVRRTLRRMTLQRVSNVHAYIKQLRNSEAERLELIRDFLIGVTQFFRNPELFDYLEKHVLPDFLKRDQEEFRVWCPGCSTGEEVFSLAMLVHELQQKTGDQRPWKIFGTDIDLEALETARRAVYGQGSVAPITIDRRKRFLSEDHGAFTVANSIRSICVFAHHNVLADPPFSKIDLISCRNLMIYFEQSAQEEVISRFHYSLNPRGFLWLGPSENLAGSTRLFETINRNARVFQREDAVPSLTPLTANTSFSISQRLAVAPPLDIALSRKSQLSVDLETETEQAFLSSFAPPFVRISHHDEVIYASENVRPFLRPAKGVPSAVLDDYFIESLRMPLRLILKAVRHSKGSEEIEDIVVDVNGENEVFDMLACPLDNDAKSILITFQPVRLREKTPEILSSRSATEKAYESELAVARKRLVARERDYELAEQELRANNEELLTMNEELQSSNEELETSREELQSVNEELETINSELIANNKELGVANSNLKNLLESTDVATLFLDSANQLRLFTPHCKELFSVQERDIGRSIFDLATQLEYPELQEDLERSATLLELLSRKVDAEAGSKHFVARIKPYQNVNGQIDGSVVSFIDVTDQRIRQKKLEETGRQLEQRIAELEAFYERSPIGVGLHGADMRYLRVNSALAETIGLQVDEIVSQHPADIIPDIWKIVEPVFKGILRTGKPALNIEVTAPTKAKDDQIRTWIANYFPVFTECKTIFGIGVTAIEVTDLKRLEKALAQKKHDLQSAGDRILGNFELAPIGITIHKGPDHAILHANKNAREFLGSDDPTGQTLDAFFPDHYEDLKPQYDAVYRTGKTQIDDEALVDVINARGDKIEGVFRRIIQPYQDEAGKTNGVICMSLDISRLVAIRDANAKQSIRLRKILDVLDTQIALVDRKATILTVNKEFASAVGRNGSELRHLNAYDVCTEQMAESSLARLRNAVGSAFDGQECDYEDQIKSKKTKTDRQVVVSVKPIMISQLNAQIIQEVVVAITDQSPLIEAIQRKDILLAELEHRVKNVIATIGAVTELTAINALDVNSMNQDLGNRLAAMARTHGKLTSSGWSSQSFSELLATELDAYALSQRKRVKLEGDELILSANSAMLIGLAIHELLTNAVKHGALSNENGKVIITVKSKDAAFKSLTWREKDGPSVVPTEREGFGTLLLQSILPSELDASANTKFDDSGLLYELCAES